MEIRARPVPFYEMSRELQEAIAEQALQDESKKVLRLSTFSSYVDIVIFYVFLIMLFRSFLLFGEHAEDHQQLERGFAQVHPCASDTNHKCRVSQMCVRWCQLAPWIICLFPF